MKIVTYNIQYGLGQDGRYDLARIADEISEADLIALQEVDRHWQRSGGVDSPAVIASHLPEHHWVYGANMDVDASFRDDQNRLVNRRRQFGTMILSRGPILSTRNFPLPKIGLAENHSIQQGALEAVVDTGRGPVRFYSVHLSHLVPATRMPQVAALLAIHDRAPREGGAWCGGHPDPASGWTEGDMPPMPDQAILLGDFNFTSQCPEFAAIVGPVDPKYGPLKQFGRFVDTWTQAGNRDEDGRTILDRPVRIDHAFVSTGLHDAVHAAWINNTATGSDHYPLWIECDF
ncbi:MAG: endonuclease/exonuclease/phosphatase family protein [Hyphomicrobiaceae bacterium]